MQAGKVKTSPLIMSIPTMDFWYWCRYFIDLYRDCPYGCSYCHTRNGSPSKGIEFEPGLPEDKEVIGFGLLSDAFHPEDVENEWASAILNSLYENGYPVNILTKSTRIVDSLQSLARFAGKDQIRVTFTILTLDESLSKKLEGCSPSPTARLEAMKALRERNIPAGVAITPIIPGANDGEESIGALVGEAKRYGANWVLFSGFDPVGSFLSDPLWGKVAELHENQGALHSLYRNRRKFLVKLLHSENLPIRIPRITLHKRSSNRLVSEYLFNISYFYELLECDVEMLRYRRAACEISRVSTSLRYLLANKKLGYIKGINPEIEKVIEEVLFTEQSSLYRSLRESVSA